MHSVRNAAESNVGSCCHALFERMCYGLDVVFDGVETETPKLSRELGYGEGYFPLRIPLPVRLGDWGSGVSSPSVVQGGAPA